MGSPCGDDADIFDIADWAGHEISRLTAALKVAEENLEKLAKLGSEPYYGNSIGNCIASATLAEIAGLKDKP